MIRNIIFDLGGVLIDWNPRYLYAEVFKEVDELEFFLTEICSPHWNNQQDAGRSLHEATETLVDRHPNYEPEIRMYYDQWTAMLSGPITLNVSLLQDLSANGDYGLYALTNWSAETFPVAKERYDFLQLFQGILVSGIEKMKKPDPEIYQLLLRRYNLHSQECLFIDDNLRNVEVAREQGIHAIHFTSHPALIESLNSLQINL